jgi:prephenate dehydrogenase
VNRFIGGHPMAGTEATGIKAANPDLFRGAAWVLALEKEEELGSFRTLANLLSGFGVRLVPLAAHRHDETVALSSHLPHILAGSLANSVSRSSLKHSILSLAAGSFRDRTRVASTLPERTTDMLWHNRKFLIEDIRAFRQILDIFAEAAEQEDQSNLRAKFEEAFRLRQELLTRNMRQFKEKFDFTLDRRRETSFLCEVGMIGGHITECELTDTMIAYNVWLPSQPV